MKTIRLKSFLAAGLLLFMALPSIKGQTVGNPAPDFTLQTLTGSTFTLSAYKGKVVFIFLFGNTCPHCLANGPNTQEKIYKVYKDNPAFVAVGVDVWDGSSAAVNNFKNLTGIEYSLCLNGSSLTGKYSSTYDRILVVDQEGILRYKSTANATSAVTAAAGEVIGNLLGGSTGMEDAALSGRKLGIYPNPARDQVSVMTPFLPGTLVRTVLSDVTGRILMREDILLNESGVMDLTVEQLPAGLYLLMTENEGRKVAARLAVSRQ